MYTVFPFLDLSHLDWELSMLNQRWMNEANQEQAEGDAEISKKQMEIQDRQRKLAAMEAETRAKRIGQQNPTDIKRRRSDSPTELENSKSKRSKVWTENKTTDKGWKVLQLEASSGSGKTDNSSFGIMLYYYLCQYLQSVKHHQ